MKENSGLQCLGCLSKTVPIESIVIIKDIPDARGEKKKFTLYLKSSKSGLIFVFFYNIKKEK